MTSPLTLDDAAVPEGGAPLNPFVVVDDAAGLITFVAEVFGVEENAQARTPLPDGRLIHAELLFGRVRLMLSDRLDGWAARPGLLQVWVRDIPAVLERAAARGASVVTPETPFYGERRLGRMLDPWQNLWWLYSPAPGEPDPAPGGTVFRTVDAAMRALT